jgi:hypothetical protein
MELTPRRFTALRRAELRDLPHRVAPQHNATTHKGLKMFKPTSPENAEIIRKLQTALREVSLGGTLTYGALYQVAGMNVQKHRHLLTRAQEAVEKELGCVFAAIRGVGIKRLPSEESPSVGLCGLRRCRSTAKRYKKRIDRINVNSLSETGRRQTIGYSAMLGAVHLISDGRKAQAVAAVADPAKPIPPANILQMFSTKDA